jgi:ribosomal protein S18 acetylase RimI-like enzyme
MPPARSKSNKPGGRLSIRLARPEEMNDVWELDRQNLAQNWDFSPLTTEPLSRAELIRRHHAIITRWWDPSTHTILVAVRNGEILGLAWYTIEIDPLFSEKIGFLFSIVVKPSARKQGIGKRLIKTFMDRVKKSGARFARLSALHQNSVAMNLYRQAGFVDESHYMLARLEATKPEKAKAEAAARKAAGKAKPEKLD